MKKRVLFLAGIVLMVASCDSSSNNNIQIQQAQIDSAARAKAILQDAINQKKNDSTINAMAAAKADSIEKATAKTEWQKEKINTASKAATPTPGK